MNSVPTTANVSASRRRLSTTNRSARSPVTAGDPIHPGTYLESNRDRSRAGAPRRAPRTARAERLRHRADGDRAVDDPRAHRADRRARSRGSRADLARRRARERPAPRRAPLQLAPRARPRAGARSFRGRVPGSVAAGPQRVSELLDLTVA